MTISKNPDARSRLWTDASHRLAGWAGDFAIATEIQALGRAEANLMRIEDRLPAIIARQQAQTEQSAFLAEDMLPDEAMAISRLWLFGLYETLRTYRRGVARKDIASKPFDSFSHNLNIVRAPLAKHQVAGQLTRHTPDLIVQPLSGRVGWLVMDPKTNAHRQVFRIDLADEFLEVAQTIVPAGIHEAQQRSLQPS